MSENKQNNPSEKDLEQRLHSLEERLSQRRGKKTEAKSSSTSGMAGFGNAMRLSSEFIAAILVGAGIGYLIDTFAGTSPWAMIILLFLGFVAGVLNVLRASGEMADPYKAGWATNPTGGSGRKEAEKQPASQPQDMYDDEDDR